MPDLWEDIAVFGVRLREVDWTEALWETGSPSLAVFTQLCPSSDGVITFSVEAELEDLGAPENYSVGPGAVVCGVE